MADIFDVVADPTRRDILRVLLDSQDAESGARGEISVSEIVAKLELSQPTVSKHLKVLRDTGLVRVREEGQHRYYQLDSIPLEGLEDWLIPFLGSAAATVSHSAGSLAAGLNDEVREFASSVGKVIADTSHTVTSAALRVTPRKWRKDQ
ncbi:MAG: metalloregulator ArsR/SmtB family transcription factor [Microbacteriaceae bacterium]